MKKKLALATLFICSATAAIPCFAATQQLNSTGEGTVTFDGTVVPSTVPYGIPTQGQYKPQATQSVKGHTAWVYTKKTVNNMTWAPSITFYYGTGSFKNLQKQLFSFTLAPLNKDGTLPLTAEELHNDGISIHSISWVGNNNQSSNMGNDTILLGNNNNIQIKLHNTMNDIWNGRFTYQAQLEKKDQNKPVTASSFVLSGRYSVAYN